MAITIDWSTKIISVPQADLTPLGGSDYELDIDTFRLALKNLEDSEEGMVFLDTHRHNTEVSVGGITLARVVEIINGYTVTFEDGQYSVNLVGANSNVGDVVNLNQVSIRSANSAGLIVSGSGVTAQDKDDIAALVLAEVVEANGSINLQQAMSLILAAVAGETADSMTTFKDPSGTTVRIEGSISGNDRTSIVITPSS